MPVEGSFGYFLERNQHQCIMQRDIYRYLTVVCQCAKGHKRQGLDKDRQREGIHSKTRRVDIQPH